MTKPIGWKKLQKLGMTPETKRLLEAADKPGKYTLSRKVQEYGMFLARQRGVDTTGCTCHGITSITTDGRSAYSHVQFMRHNSSTRRYEPVFTIPIPNWDFVPEPAEMDIAA
jgi:hypothetical protein